MKSEINNSAQKEEHEVLIIDDEVDICQLIILILKHNNIKASYANSLDEAKKMLMIENPRLVFLDNHLPDGTGIDFINYIKTQAPQSKVVMITAHNTDSNRKRAMENGAVHFIGKPFHSDEIMDTIKNFF